MCQHVSPPEHLALLVSLSPPGTGVSGVTPGNSVLGHNTLLRHLSWSGGGRYVGLVSLIAMY